jgi:hypothetical protein
MKTLRKKPLDRKIHSSPFNYFAAETANLKKGHPGTQGFGHFDYFCITCGKTSVSRVFDFNVVSAL